MPFIKLRQVLGLAAKKMEGVPEATIDEICKKNNADKDTMAMFLKNLYGIEMLSYRKTLEWEFSKMEKQPRRKIVKNSASRYPYYSFFTKDKFFLPMARKIWEGKDMRGEAHWESFVQRFNEAMNVGHIPYKEPPQGRAGVTYDKGEVEWESDDVYMIVLAEMRHFRDNPYIENNEWTTWEHYRDAYVEAEMVRHGWAVRIDDFLHEE